MTRVPRAVLTAAASGMLAACLSGSALAQAWPTRPVTIVVTFSPGGSSDIVARLMQAPLQAALGQPVLVDNKPGAGGTIGAAAVAKAAPDGYTLLLSNSAPISISPFMLAQRTYDPVSSFSHVAYIGSVANVFVVHPSVTAKTLPELATWIRAQSAPVAYGSGGIGSIGHIVGETFKNGEGLKMEHVGYKGSSPMHNDLLAGTIKLAIDTLPQNVPFMREGKLKAIAVTSPTRAPLAPDVPSVLESKQPRLVAENFLGISGPTGLPLPRHHAPASGGDQVADRRHHHQAHGRPRRARQVHVAGGVHRVRQQAGGRVGGAGQGLWRNAQLTRGDVSHRIATDRNVRYSGASVIRNRVAG